MPFEADAVGEKGLGRRRGQEDLQPCVAARSSLPWGWAASVGPCLNLLPTWKNSYCNRNLPCHRTTEADCHKCIGWGWANTKVLALDAKFPPPFNVIKRKPSTAMEPQNLAPESGSNAGDWWIRSGPHLDTMLDTSCTELHISVVHSLLSVCFQWSSAVASLFQ